MGSMSRCKGAAGEREAVGKLNEVLGTRFHRGRQYHGGLEVAAGRGGEYLIRLLDVVDACWARLESGPAGRGAGSGGWTRVRERGHGGAGRRLETGDGRRA
jgi:hypothetical protein